MAVVHGKEGVVKAGGSAIGNLTGFTLETTADVVEKTGSWFSYGGQKIGQGREKVILLLSEDKKVRKEIKKKVESFLGSD